MKNINKVLAIHYHTVVGVKNKQMTVEFYTGLWIESLAKKFKKIILIAFTDNTNYKFELNSSNLEIIDLGPKPTRFKNFYTNFPKYYNILIKNINHIDCLGVRMPTPLGVFISFIFRRLPKFFYIIGSMPDIIKSSDENLVKKGILYLFWRLDQHLYRMFKNNTVFIGNNENYKNKFSYIKDMKTIPTSTISKSDIINKPRTLNGSNLRLIFIGRVDVEKGLGYLIEAASMLYKKDIRFSLKIVGVKDDSKKRILENLIKKHNLLKFVKLIPFTNEINEIFAHLDKSDLLIIPSIWDSQPRVAWEAMARGVPVLASKGVQSLQNEKPGTLIFETKSARSIFELIIRVKSSKIKYYELSKEGLNLALSKTLENSTEMLLKEIKF